MVNVFTDASGVDQSWYLFPLWAIIMLALLLFIMLALIIGVYVWVATKKTDTTNQGPRGPQGFLGAQGPTGSGGGGVGTDIFPTQFDEFTIQRPQLIFSPTTMALWPVENQFIRFQYAITTRRLSPTTVRRNVVLSGGFGIVPITGGGSTQRFVLGFNIPPTVAGNTLATPNFTFVGAGASPNRVITPFIGFNEPTSALTEVTIVPASSGLDCTLSWSPGANAYNQANAVTIQNFEINFWHDDLLPQ